MDLGGFKETCVSQMLDKGTNNDICVIKTH